MAREEHPREDLLAEAKTLVERVSLELNGSAAPVFVGFRRDHGASFYFGSEPVYQFTSNGSLRRAFVDDLLYKADRGRLVALTRRRTPEEVQLISHTLDGAAAKSLLDEMQSRLDGLHHALAKNHFRILGQVPAEADLVRRIRCWLDEFVGRIEIAPAPRAR
jgi:hypothetical protein